MSYLSDFKSKSYLSGFKNKIINGCFRVCQREDPTVAEYYLDRWKWRTLSLSGGTINQAQTSSFLDSGEFVNTLTATLTNYTGLTYLAHYVENVKTLSGKDFTLSGWFKPSQNIYVTARINQYFGTGSTDSGVPYEGTTTYCPAGQWTKVKISDNFASVENKDILADNMLIIEMLMSGDVGNTTPVPDCTIEIANMQLEEGLKDTEFENRFLSIEQELCFRYYVSTKEDSIYDYRIMGEGITSDRISTNVRFPVPMRIIPTCKIFSDGSQQEGYVEIYNGATQYGPGATAAHRTALGFQRVSSVQTAITIGGHYMIRYTADAEF